MINIKIAGSTFHSNASWMPFIGFTSSGAPVPLLVGPDGSLAPPSTSRGTPVARDGIANGSSQTIADANAARSYLSFQNPSTNAHSMWVNIRGGAAVADNTCLEAAPGQGFVMSAGAFVSVAAITVIGTPGESWHASEA